MSYSNVQTRPMPFPLRYLNDLATFRHLAWNLVGADLRARFRRSKVGIAWAVIQPLAFSLLIAAVWSSVFKMASYWDYAIFVFSGMIIWEYFSGLIIVGQDALINAEAYLRQTRIPFLIFQVRTPFSSMVVLLCGFVGLIGLMAVLGKLPPFGFQLLLVPVFLVVFALFSIPIVILMSILGATFRDVKYISQIGVQAMFFVSPVMLERAVFDRPELQVLHYVNPMVPLLDMFRAPILHGNVWQQADVLTILAWIVVAWSAAILVSARTGRSLIYQL